MKRFLWIPVLLAIALWTGSNAFAEGLPVNLTPPEHWDSHAKSGDNSYHAAYTKKDTESRIEVYSKDLVRMEQADTLFEAFSKKLQSEDRFKQTEDTNKQYQLKDGTTREGHYYEYSYTYDNILVSVNIFAFAVQNTAIFVIAYYADANKTEAVDSFETLIKNMTQGETAAAN